MPKIGRTFMPGLHRAMRFQMESGDFPVPVLWLKFGENTGTEAKDSSPEGNDGTLHVPTWTTGHLGPGLLFDGIDDYVDCGAGSGMDLVEALTIAAWVKPDTAGVGTRTIFYRGNEEPRGGYALNQEMNVFNGYFYDTAWRRTGSSDTVISADEWYFVVITYDKEKLKLYVSGSLEKEPEFTTDVNVAADAYTYIGAVEAGFQEFSGIIDEVAVWSEALSAQRVREWYYGIR